MKSDCYSLREKQRLLLPEFAKLIALIAFFSFAVSNCILAQTDVSANYTYKPVNMGGAGWVTGLVFHPTVANVVYCRTDVGGAFKWDSGNSRWIPLVTNSVMPGLVGLSNGGYGAGARPANFYEVESIAVDPQNANTVYIAMGSEYDSQGGILVKSTNGGASFNVLTNFGNIKMTGNGILRVTGERIAVDPSNSSKIFYGSVKDGLRVSTDGGTSWSQVSTLPVGTTINESGAAGTSEVGVNVVVFESSSRVYASVAGSGIYRSNDGGATWTQILSSMATELRVAGGNLVACILKGGVRTYNPSTNTWTSSTVPNNSVIDIAVKPGNANVIYAVTEGFGAFYRSTNGGTSWTTLSTNNSASGQANFKSTAYPWKEATDLRSWLSVGEIEFNPLNSNDLWFAEGMGTWRSTNVSDTNNSPLFNDNSQGIEELVANGVWAAPGGKLNVVGWDRQGFHYTNPDVAPNAQIGLTQNFTSAWSIISSPSDPNFLVVPATDHRDFADANTSGYSTDGGTTWTRFGSVPSGSMFGEIAVSAGNNNNNLVWRPRNYSATMYYSNNRGASWSTCNISGFSDDNAHYQGFKRLLAADGVTPSKFYIFSNNDGKIFQSTDGGANWSFVANTPFAWGRSTKLRSVPGIANHLWLVTGHNSEFTYPSSAAGLYFSSNGGSSFTKMAGFDQCWAIGFGKKQNTAQAYPTIFAYGRYNNVWGLYRSIDQGSNWSKCATYVLDRLNAVNDITGDPDVFGKVYLAMGATGFVYGTTSETGSSNVAVTSVSVSPTSASVAVGATTTLTATVAPSNATNQSVTWSSSNIGVATVSSTGVVTGVAAGTATITVTTQDGSKTATATITVTSSTVAVTSVSVSPTSASVAVGATTTLTATVAPSNATNQSVTWSSSNTGVASVSSTGVVTGVAAGTATITVTTQDGAKTATATITVTSGSTSSGLMIYDEALASGWDEQLWTWGGTTNLNNATNVHNGSKSAKLDFAAGSAWGALILRNTATINPANYPGGYEFWVFAPQLSKLVTHVYTTSNDASAIGWKTFDVPANTWTKISVTWAELGNVTSVHRIRIGDRNQTARPYSIYIDEVRLLGGGSNVAVTSVSVSPTSASVAVGATTTLTATVAPSNATNKNVTWSSSNIGVATVSSTGVVTGVAAGTATITVTTQDGAKTATATITVTSSTVAVTSVSVSPTSASVAVGATTTLTATVAPSNATNKNVTWSSSNTGVATVSSTGVVTGVAAGTATITVTTQDGAKTATATITVTSGGGTSGLMIYDEALASGWSASAWNTTYNLGATSPVYAGTKSIAVTFTAAWGALNIEKSTAQSTSGYDRMRMWINTNGAASRNVQIVFINSAGAETGRKVINVTNGWNQYDILFSQVGNPANIKRFYIHDGTGRAQSAIYVDNIRLTNGATNLMETGNEPVLAAAKPQLSNGFKVFPNPTRDQLNLEFEVVKNEKEATMELFDLLGRKVMSQKLSVSLGINRHAFSLENLPKGTYTLHLNVDEQLSVQKLVVE
jgi:uncharacterized protein YjdB